MKELRLALKKGLEQLSCHAWCLGGCRLVPRRQAGVV
jgi:hypothetical protein